MKKPRVALLVLSALLLLLFGAAGALAQEESAGGVSQAAAATVAVATPAPPPAAPALPDRGDTAWLMAATAFVILMSVPGLALFYGGLVRSKNMLSVLMQVFVIFCLVSVLWAVYGYSLAFSGGNAVIGSFDKFFLKGITPASVATTFSKGVVIPEFVYVTFQGAFAAITVSLVIGSFVERIRFSALLLFAFLWFSLAYLPIAHMVWYWPGPDGYVSQAAADRLNGSAGWLFRMGALDFAGGTVVHINAAIAGIVGAHVVGKRVGYGRDSMAPHSLAFTMVGASLLWFGWFGFNAGSALEASGTAALAMVNTWLAASAATLSWMLVEWLLKGKPSMLGAVSGAVGGLVAITPACGLVGIAGALAIGFLAGATCLWGVTGLKRLIGADDSLDVFGLHGVGGILGSLLTAIFAAPALGGSGIYDYVANAPATDYSILGQLWRQALAVATAVAWSGAVALAACKLADLLLGLRVAEEEEREGLDISAHGESAYHHT